MSESEVTWVLLVRDVSAAARVGDAPRTVATMILDGGSGLIRGASVAVTPYEACADAVQAAITQPAGPLPAAEPATVVYHDGDFAEDALDAVRDVLPGEAPRFVAAPPIPEAEDIFDSLVGQLAGRPQPVDPPSRENWQDLYAHGAAFCRAEPWLRRADDDLLDLELEVDGSTTRYVAVVLGQAGIQRGLAVYPRSGLSEHPAEEPPPVPPGSVLFWLDPPAELPVEYAAKAARYGWPTDLDLAPIPATIGDTGLADIGRDGTRHLAVALAAVTALDDAGSPPSGIDGSVSLSDGTTATFTITP